MKNNDRSHTKIYNSFIDSGLLADIKPTHLKLLFAICSHMDGNGECCESMATLAKDTGMTVHNVRHYLTGRKDGLIYYRFNGQPLVELVGKRNRKNGSGQYNVFKCPCLYIVVTL